MEKYRKIRSFKDIKFVELLGEMIDVYDNNPNVEWFFGYKFKYRWSCFQCIKSDENKSTIKISEYNEDEHVRDGNYDPEYVEEMFDETTEVYDGWSYSIWLSKIISKEFISSFFGKIKDHYNSYKGSDIKYESINEFMEKLNINMGSVETYLDFVENLGGDSDDYEVMYDETDIDEHGNLIKWFSYGQLDEEDLLFGYKII